MAQKGVRTENPEYSAAAGLWQRCDDCVEGEHRIHSRGMTYLPKLTEEEPIDYVRLERNHVSQVAYSDRSDFRC
jgi:hypothetical protein